MAALVALETSNSTLTSEQQSEAKASPLDVAQIMCALVQAGVLLQILLLLVYDNSEAMHWKSSFCI